jgi:ABC-2 type transport system permease protein
MWAIYRKEVVSFLSSITGYLVISVFLILLGLFMWVFPDTSVLNYNYATLSQLFDLSPFIFLFLIPAITMRSFSEEFQVGTMELISTKPLTDSRIILGKYFAIITLVLIALIPTLFYVYSVYDLGAPKGNIDLGAVWGSYLGLMLLASSFSAIGLFASSLTSNQIIAFLLAVVMCFFLYLSFQYISKFPAFVGTIDDLIQRLGMDYHYESLSKGLIDSRDVIYFLSIIGFFLIATQVRLSSRRW